MARHLVHRRKGIEQGQRERDVLRQTLGVELVVRRRQLGAAVGEEQREVGVQLARRQLALLQLEHGPGDDEPLDLAPPS